MNVTSTMQTQSTQNASSSASSGTSLDTTFAQLLVAQLKSQDPLNPMDPTQFVSQLVGLNTLDAVTNIYQLLSAGSTAASTASAVTQSTRGAH